MANKSTNVRIKLMRGVGRLAPRLVAELALRKFATPPPPQRNQRFATRFQAFQMRVAGDRVEGFAFGESGPSIVLVHGWGGFAPQLGAFVEPLCGAGYRVLAFDAPAHGTSAGKRSSLPLFVDSLAALSDRFGEPAGVVAHSFGCAASAIAMGRGLGIGRAVFLAPFVDPQVHFGRFADALGLDLGLVIELAERRYRAKWSELAILELARTFTQPLLVFHDRADRAIALAEAQSIALAWPGAELRVTDGLGHMQILRDPAIVAQAVEFLGRAIDRRAAAPRTDGELEVGRTVG